MLLSILQIHPLVSNRLIMSRISQMEISPPFEGGVVLRQQAEGPGWLIIYPS
jgi:hypothetical protein